MDIEKFFTSVGTMMKPRMNMSLYVGSFDCACGKQHHLSPGSVEVHAEGRSRIVVSCPDDGRYFTNVAIKLGFMGMSFKGFESISGHKCETEDERLILLYTFQTSLK